MSRQTVTLMVLSAALVIAGYAGFIKTREQNQPGGTSLAGAWQAKVQFKSGAFATVKDFEFMYVFNAGGTMTESSNYDSLPPVPPAYGVWRKLKARQYEAKYRFFWTKPPKAVDELATGGGWPPGGFGVLTEEIALALDGKSYQSRIRLELFDQAGKPIEGGAEADAQAVRIGF
jgi:hypothetical protein